MALSVKATDRDSWTAAAAGFADHNYRQTWDYGVHAARRVGGVSEHVAVQDGARVVALADVRVRKLPIVGGGIAYVTGGPLTASDGVLDVERFVAVVRALREEFAVRRGLVLRVVPPIGAAAWNRDVGEALTRDGFAPAAEGRPYRTMLVDVARPLADVRRTLHQKWRNCLNRAEREGVVVQEADDVGSLDAFRRFFDDFVARKGFDARVGADFYAAVQRDLPPTERLVVLTAKKDGAGIAWHVGSALGDTSVYLLGATAPEALTCKAAYLLQWRAIERAHAAGRRWYDLGGVDPDENPGVFHFKEGLGGIDVSAAGPLEWRVGARSRLALAVESRYRALRRARSPATVSS
jgi:CelD/BcsL family acetyltransferase involved in cellulose biosynthesis